MLGLLVVPAVHAAVQPESQGSLALPATAVTSAYEQQSYKASESRSAMKIDARCATSRKPSTSCPKA